MEREHLHTPSFGKVLDGLIVVDLGDVERRFWRAYMGRADAAAFRVAPVAASTHAA